MHSKANKRLFVFINVPSSSLELAFLAQKETNEYRVIAKKESEWLSIRRKHVFNKQNHLLFSMFYNFNKDLISSESMFLK